MTNASIISAQPWRISASIKLAGLALVAGLAYGATAAPALAAPSDWRGGCQFAAAPQGYGDMIRYNNCVRQQDCQELANAQGATVFASGCFWVSPESSPASATGRRTH